MKVAIAALVATVACRREPDPIRALPETAPAPEPLKARALPTGGIFDGLEVYVSADGRRLTTTFRSATGWNDVTKAPRFVCNVDLTGRRRSLDEPFAVRPQDDWAHSPHGTLEFVDRDTLRIRLEHDIAGCWNVDPRFDTDITKGVSFVRTPGKTFGRPCRVVKAERAYLREVVDGPTTRRPYVTRFDRLFVLEERGDWLRVRHEDGRKPTEGFVRESELHGL